MALTFKESAFLRWTSFLPLLTVCFSEPNIGGVCNLSTGTSGICKSIHNCPSVLNGLKHGERPKSCGFIGFHPIVCCPDGSTPLLNASSGPSVPLRLATPNNDPQSIMHPKNVSQSNDLPVNASTKIMAAIGRKPGDAAKYWCEQYFEKCDSGFHRRFKRDIGPTEIIDYDVIGTSESPVIETTTQRKNDHTWLPPFIVGGELAIMDEFPHMAAIGFGEENSVKWECGGTLISENFVLTAAHCLMSRSGSPAEWVHLGASVLSDSIRGRSLEYNNGQTHRVIRRIRHPEYRRPSKYNDVALLELGPSLKSSPQSLMSRSIHPACLQVEDESSINSAIAIGWGRVLHGGDLSPNLLKVELSILNNSICNESYQVEIRTAKLKKGMDNSVICAGELKGDKDTCQGDSGGPLQIKLEPGHCKYKVIGITSFGKFCGFQNSPAVYMRVSHYVPWIESIVWPET